MNMICRQGFSRRCFLKAVATGGAAATAGSVCAGISTPVTQALPPHMSAPVRALHGDVPYFDCSGRATPAKRQKARPQKPISALSAEAQYLMGAW